MKSPKQKPIPKARKPATRLTRIALLIKGFFIAGPIISNVERRTGTKIREPRSDSKRHRIPAAFRARLDYARAFAASPKKDDAYPSDFA